MVTASISSQPFILSRITNTPHHQQQPLLPSIFFLRRPNNRRPFLFTTCCHHIDGGGVGGGADDVVSTRKSTFNKGFTVIANMLRRIKPLDNSVISKGVSDISKDSMKQTISTMLGLLPSDHFQVTVNLDIQPLHRLLVSSIITGYTLWNAEYRMSLTRNLEMSCGDRGSDCETPLETLEVNGGREDREEREDGEEIEKVVSDLGFKDLEICSSSTSSGAGVFGDLPPQALKYIQQLQSELTNMTEELNAQKQEMMQLEHDRGIRNNLLEYLRSFDPNVVAEMSRPSSVEVEDIIHQLVQNILRRFLLDDASSNFIEQSVEDYHPDSDDEFSDTVATSRDYLAKLLFWCMLLGHHLRGLENRLHLSCVVGLL
ncbi:uncharacterized protein LOC123906479 [Trifolium pratense]|uniref:uncharacterized protein LOC123906479 n=1 Tax=Trifolium pratense TaxID=57577 RepID=UPI001E690E25|nr:uncharacterized protein LOC123906479 [Trifolium pratense]